MKTFSKEILDLTRGKTPFNSSRTATARAKNVLPIPSECNLCGGPVEVVTHEEIYGRLYGDWPFAYRCEHCDSYVGMHPFTNIPLGTLADAEIREARKKCKPAFEKLWKNSAMFTRSEAYAYLAKQMNIPVEHCHFGWFDIEQCYKAKAICEHAWRSHD